MQLRNKITGKLYDITGGKLIDAEVARKKDITGSFLELKAVDDGEEVLYIWPYFGDQEYTIEGLEVYDVESITPASDASANCSESESSAISDASGGASEVDTGADN